MNILVTGGAGYLGSTLVPLLLHVDHHVHVVDTFRHGEQSLAPCCAHPNFAVTRADARRLDLFAEIVRWADAIVPLAAIVGAPACEGDRHAAVTTNYDAVRNLVDLASPEQLIVYPNTNSGYGTGGDEPLTEETPLRPLSLYAASKADAETVVLARHNSISLRFATLFGASPRMRVDLLVNDFVHRAVHDRALTVFEGHARRNYLHVRDATRAILYAVTHAGALRGRAYNVGLDDANLSKVELCQQIARHVPGFVWHEALIGADPDKRDYIVSNERIRRVGFRTKHTLDDGIVELIKLYQMLQDRRYGNA